MDEQLVTVATYVNPGEAELARMHLEGEGLTAFLADMEIVNMHWLLGNAMGNIKLQVPGSQAETAAVILAKLPKPRTATEEEDSEESLCLACGEEMAVSESKCPACGWSYEKEKEG